jgi:hypothetical protein
MILCLEKGPMRTLQHNTGEPGIDLELSGAIIQDVQQTRSEGVRWFLAMSRGEQMTIDIGRTATSPDGTEISAAQPELVSRVLKGGVVRSSGQLELEFLSGATFIFGPAPAYESWTAFRSDGYGVVCMPGGELAIFIPAEAE